MTAPDTTAAIDPGATPLTRPFVLLGATAVGVIVTNLFAPHILVGQIGRSLGMTTTQAGMISTLTLLGYALGLFMLVPLADLFENKRLILSTLMATILTALATALAPSPVLLLAAVFCLGASCAAIQMLVPLIASMAAAADRGRVIGDVMSGLMIGILLSRPLASLIGGIWSWRGFYAASAVAMTLLAAALAKRLPSLRPAGLITYPRLIASFWTLLRDEPVVRLRSWTAALAMASFSAFWAAAALRLTTTPFRLDATGIAVFALAGAAGAAAAPIAGRLGDRGHSRALLIGAHVTIIVSQLLAAWAATVASQNAGADRSRRRRHPARHRHHGRPDPRTARHQPVAARSPRPPQWIVCRAVLHRRRHRRGRRRGGMGARRLDRGMRGRRPVRRSCARHRPRYRQRQRLTLDPRDVNPSIRQRRHPATAMR